MKTNFAKHTLKDSVFTHLFRDRKYLLELYRTLHPADTITTAYDLKNVTLSSVLSNTIYNDLGFRVGSQLLALVEAQSTWSLNIVVRGLFYLSRTYMDYLDETQQNVYASKKVSIPAPELYVIYSGDRKKRPPSISLTDSFFCGIPHALEVRVKVLYLDEDSNDIINQYLKFTKVYDEQVKLYGRTRRAVSETLALCQEQNILREYLKTREKEVHDIMMDIFDQEYIWKMHARALTNDVTARVTRNVTRKVTRKEQEKAIRACCMLGATFPDTVRTVADTYKLSLEQAEAAVKRYWNK